jgi:hypothetical protein
MRRFGFDVTLSITLPVEATHYKVLITALSYQVKVRHKQEKFKRVKHVIIIGNLLPVS